MKLYLNEASPYARLIRILLLETGLEKETDLIFIDPWTTPTELLASNPASKVPALALSGGTHLVESSCIADYLISRAGRSDLAVRIHSGSAERIEVLGLSRSAIDCSFGSVIQQRFAPQSPLIERWQVALPRIAERLEALHVHRVRGDQIDLADVCAGVAFEYIDFRLPEIKWRSLAPSLATHVSRLAERNSFKATRPK